MAKTFTSNFALYKLTFWFKVFMSHKFISIYFTTGTMYKLQSHILLIKTFAGIFCTEKSTNERNEFVMPLYIAFLLMTYCRLLPFLTWAQITSWLQGNNMLICSINYSRVCIHCYLLIIRIKVNHKHKLVNIFTWQRHCKKYATKSKVGSCQSFQSRDKNLYQSVIQNAKQFLF